MYCSSCGTKVNKDTKFCQKCGAPLINNNNETKQIMGSYNLTTNTQPQKKGGCFRNLLIGLLAVICVGVIGLFIISLISGLAFDHDNQRGYYDRGDIPVIETDDEMTVGNTMIIIRQLSEMYIEASELTGEIYATDPTVTSYEDWKDDLDEAMDLWDTIDDYSETFAGLLDDVDYKTGLEFDLQFGSTAYAYSKEDITAFYDNAPKGTGKARIELLAENLGVSAKKAFLILKMSNDQLEAEAWNNAGDTFEKLEQGATAIKAVSDVAVAVGTTVASGGTVGGVSLIGKGVTIIKNVDLVLGVAGDMAFVILGEDAENNSIVANINEIKSYTGIVSSVDDLICIDTDKINDVAVYTIKGVNDYLQNDQILGIDVSDINKDDETLDISLLDDDEIGDYIDDNNIEVEDIEAYFDIRNTDQDDTDDIGNDGQDTDIQHNDSDDPIDPIATDDGQMYTLTDFAGTYVMPASNYESLAIMELGTDGFYKHTQYYYDLITDITTGYYYTDLEYFYSLYPDADFERVLSYIWVVHKETVANPGGEDSWSQKYDDNEWDKGIAIYEFDIEDGQIKSIGDYIKE